MQIGCLYFMTEIGYNMTFGIFSLTLKYVKAANLNCLWTVSKEWISNASPPFDD
jgi:hypothetical protein